MDATDASASDESARENSTYVHRTGTREYLASEAMPYLQQALEALAVQLGKERLKLAADKDLADGQYLPHHWRPFCAHRWLAEYLITHKPVSAFASEQPALSESAEALP